MMIKYSIYLLLLSAFFSCGSSSTDTENATEIGVNTPEEVAAQKAAAPARGGTSFKDGMTGKVWQNYLHVRTALVNTDADEAAVAAGNLTEALTSERADLKKAAMAISKAKDIETQRVAFVDLSVEMEKLLDGALSNGTVYKQHCPMAFDGAGANWLSEVSEIRNPYYGDKMLKCGKVVAEIK
ncbi:hypothetical protein CEQ90_04160 [Lewinellaceae bacterium SD302]|nr:hypothetical protein CEQ90_04160 [Lewinellaceae bacterium SD302]